MEKFPKSIPPEGEAKVTLLFKPGTQTGRKRLTFTVDTDSKDEPIRRFSLFANCVAECEINPIDSTGGPLRIGESGRRTYQVICRRVGDEGRGLPKSVTASQELKASFLDRGTERHESGDVIESVQTVEVALPPSAQPGQQRGELLFRWDDGHTRTRSVAWETTPRIRVAPTGLVIKAGPTEETLALTSADRPFRILSVSCPLLAEEQHSATDAQSSHRVRLALDGSKSPAGRVVELAIVTDLPEQPKVTVSVLVLPVSEEGAP